MQLEGSFTYTAVPQDVWELITNPPALAQAMPDCEAVEQVAPHRYAGRLHVHAGALQGKFQGLITLTDVQPPRAFSLHADGQSPEGRLTGRGKVWLEPSGKQTILHYSGNIDAGGKISAVGELYLQTVARSLLRQINSGLRQRLEEGGRVETAVVPASPPPEINLAKLSLIALLTSIFTTFLAAFTARAAYRRWIMHLAARVAQILAERDHKQDVRS